MECSDQRDFVSAGSLPVGQDGDVYVMRDILHDWSDVKAAEILGNIRHSMGASDSRLALVEVRVMLLYSLNSHNLGRPCKIFSIKCSERSKGVGAIALSQVCSLNLICQTRFRVKPGRCHKQEDTLAYFTQPGILS